MTKTQYLPSISYGFMVKEWYYVPAFSRPKTVERKFRNVIAITDVTRELLIPLTVGMKIEDIGDYVAPGSYDTPTLTMEHTFSGFRYCTPYKVTPVVNDFFGLQLDAVPERDIYLEPEVVTGGATAVTEHSAVLHGSIPDAEYDGFQGAGIRVLGRGDHACAIGGDGSLTVSVGGLAEETAYQYQAYLLCEGHVFYGAVETFFTKGHHDDGDGETTVKPPKDNNDDDFKFVYIEPRDHFKYVKKFADGSTVLAGAIGTRFIEKNYRLETYYVYNLASKTASRNTLDEEDAWISEGEGDEVINGTHDDWVERGGYLPFPVELSAFYNHEFMKVFLQVFDTSDLKKYLVREEVICGVKCRVFDTKGFNGHKVRFCVDPKNGWCLKYEDYGGSGRNDWELTEYDTDYRAWTSDIAPRRMWAAFGKG